MLYKTLILPIIDYGDIIYDGMSQRNAMALQRVQNMAFKNILKAPKLTPTAKIHGDLNMLTFKQRRYMHGASQMYKVHTGICPTTTLKLFVRRTNISSHCTRASTTGDFNIPHVRLQCTKRCFTYKGPMIWDSLPRHLKLLPNQDQFETHIRKWLLDGDNVLWSMPRIDADADCPRHIR